MNLLALLLVVNLVADREPLPQYSLASEVRDSFHKYHDYEEIPVGFALESVIPDFHGRIVYGVFTEIEYYKARRYLAQAILDFIRDEALGQEVTIFRIYNEMIKEDGKVFYKITIILV